MRPIFIILASFISGILLQAYFNGAIDKTTILVLLIVCMGATALATLKKRPYATLLTYPCFILLGALFILPSMNTRFPPDHISALINSEEGPFGTNLEGVLLKAPENRDGLTRLYLEATKSYPSNGAPRKISGRLRLTVRNKNSNEPLNLKLYRGDRIRTFARLSRPRNFMNPGGFDYEWWLARKGIFVTGRVSNADFLIKTAGNRDGFLRRIEIIRERVNGFIDSRGLPDSSSAIIKALVTGEKGSIDETTREAFIRTGTAHILAISGLHVGIVALFSFLVFFNILRRFEKLSLALNIRKLSWALALIPIGFYGLLTGLPVSTQRAIIMVSVFVFAFLLDRSRDLYAALALAALVVLVFHPGSLWDASFQFSFAAVFAIFYLVEKFNILFSRKAEIHLPKDRNRTIAWLSYRVRILIFITAAASIATLPLTAYHFNNVALTGMPLNLIAVPIVSILIVPLSLVSVLAIPVSETLATFLFTLDSFLINALVHLIKTVSAPDWSLFLVSTISLVEIISFYLIIFTLFGIKKKRYLLYALPILLTGLTFPAVSNYYQRITSKELRVTFLNVGQGEASFIEFPGGKTMLIDGGAASFGYKGGFDMGEMVVSPFLRYKRIKRIDYLVLSHAQRDHKGGLASIAKDFRIGEFWYNGFGDISEIAKALDAREVKSVVIASTTKPIDINGVLVRMLNPPPLKGSKGELNLNEASLVMELTYKEKKILFTGDIGFQTEELIHRKIKGTDLLKAPHHGSRYSSSTAFINSASPSFVVFSVGFKNHFGFPHKETLARYSKTGSIVFRTDMDGAVLAVTDGKKLELKPYRRRL